MNWFSPACDRLASIAKSTHAHKEFCEYGGSEVYRGDKAHRVHLHGVRLVQMLMYLLVVVGSRESRTTGFRQRRDNGRARWVFTSEFGVSFLERKSSKCMRNVY
ncbi:hypothetical protein EVAR_14194_1 [Eumeta japonica]|uniref:Uncharacterized protein n=1 Tax=Eumeta variegata TaxID=151549 RepID=A0A4C1UEH9_EUMVA|nr:hypothetical protein EVAR_14194_1 [Eumeta japonica]